MPESRHLTIMRETLALLEKALTTISDVKDHAEEKERIEILRQDIQADENWERLQDARGAQARATGGQV